MALANRLLVNKPIPRACTQPNFVSSLGELLGSARCPQRAYSAQDQGSASKQPSQESMPSSDDTGDASRKPPPRTPSSTMPHKESQPVSNSPFSQSLAAGHQNNPSTDEQVSTTGKQESSQSDSSQSNDLASSLQGLLESMHARTSRAQTQAQKAFAAVRHKAQAKLAESTDRQKSSSINVEEHQRFAARMYSKLQGLSAAVNQLTGYTTVEHLKKAVAEADKNLIRLRQDMDQKKQAHEAMLEMQLNLQRDLNSLLQKKSSWVDQDVSKFTELCRIEHKTDADVTAARGAYEKAADEVDAAQLHLFKAIRERYTEEQLWGDKIRRTATWWTWGLMGLQMLSFMGVIFVVEPRRVRLMQGLLQESLQQHQASMQEYLNTQLEGQFAQVRQAVHDSREVNVVLHSLDEMGLGDGRGGVDGSVQHMQLAAQGGGGSHHTSRVGDEKGEEVAKVLSAVVTFMDGLHTELSVMRSQLQRLEAAGKPAQFAVGAPVFASDTFALSHPDQEGVQWGDSGPAAGVDGGGGGLVLGSSHIQQEENEAEGAGGEPGHDQQHSVDQRRGWWKWVGLESEVSPEQAAGVAAAVGSGVGAVIGALLVAYFSSGR